MQYSENKQIPKAILLSAFTNYLVIPYTPLKQQYDIIIAKLAIVSNPLSIVLIPIKVNTIPINKNKNPTYLSYSNNLIKYLQQGLFYIFSGIFIFSQCLIYLLSFSTIYINLIKAKTLYYIYYDINIPTILTQSSRFIQYFFKISNKFGDRKQNNQKQFNNHDNRNDRKDFGGRKDFNNKNGDKKNFGPKQADNRNRQNGGKFGGKGGNFGGNRTLIKPHQSYPGCYVSVGKTETLLTKSMAPIGVSVYGEKKVLVQEGNDPSNKVEYREWNPFRSKLGAAILCRVSYCPIVPGAKVLYLGAASGTTVSHVSDMVGPKGNVYAVEFSKRSGRDLIEMAKQRPNVSPIIADARHPYKYRMMVPEVDAIFSDVAQPDQAHIVVENAKFYLKNGGGMMISIKASSVNSTMAPEQVFEQESQTLINGGFKVDKWLSIDEFHKNHAIIVGKFMVN